MNLSARSNSKPSELATLRFAWCYCSKHSVLRNVEPCQVTFYLVTMYGSQDEEANFIVDRTVDFSVGSGAQQFDEYHLANTTTGGIRLLIDATFHRVRHLVEKNSQVRHSVEIVKS